MMYSCTSLGVKLGGGLGIAITGWLLEASGFDGTVAVQSASCMNMLNFMYLWVTMIISAMITFVLSRMKVEKANEELRKNQETLVRDF